MDKRSGGRVKENLELLSKIEGEKPMADSEVDSYHHQALHNLLQHCVDTVPAYSELGYLLSKENPLSEWPVVNKMILRDSNRGYLSSEYQQDSIIPMTTSGSTGTPFTSWQDLSKKRHVNAEVLHYNGKIGYHIGRKIIYFRSVVNEVAKSGLQQFMQNIHLIDCTDLSDEGIRTKLKQIKKLSRIGGAMILSYASTLDAFRRYFDKYGNDEAKGCNIYGIVSGSEMLQDITRDSLAIAFRCKVVSRYANEENGFLGQDDVLNNVFVHNRANYFIEILKIDSDKPVEIGEIGRIVVTDLYNYAMPMVRYDTGDVGAWREISVNGVKRRAIGQFGGRKVDMIFDSAGNVVSPHAITNSMWKYASIKQFQLIQTDRDKYTLRLNTDKPINQDEILSVYRRILGEDAHIDIELCDEIPVLSSGKRRYIVNQMLSTSK